jgi:hypothetical protein
MRTVRDWLGEAVLGKLGSAFEVTGDFVDSAFATKEGMVFKELLTEILAEPDCDEQWAKFVVSGVLIKGIYTNFTEEKKKDELKKFLMEAITGKGESAHY